MARVWLEIKTKCSLIATTQWTESCMSSDARSSFLIVPHTVSRDSNSASKERLGEDEQSCVRGSKFVYPEHITMQLEDSPKDVKTSKLRRATQSQTIYYKRFDISVSEGRCRPADKRASLILRVWDNGQGSVHTCVPSNDPRLGSGLGIKSWCPHWMWLIVKHPLLGSGVEHLDTFQTYKVSLQTKIQVHPIEFTG